MHTTQPLFERGREEMEIEKWARIQHRELQSVTLHRGLAFTLFSLRPLLIIIIIIVIVIKYDIHSKIVA